MTFQWHFAQMFENMWFGLMYSDLFIWPYYFLVVEIEVRTKKAVKFIAGYVEYRT